MNSKGAGSHASRTNSPQNTLADNIQCAALLFAAIESAHTGQEVDVQAYLRRHLEDAVM